MCHVTSCQLSRWHHNFIGAREGIVLLWGGWELVSNKDIFGFHLSRSFSRYRDRDGQIPDIAVPRRPRFIRVPASYYKLIHDKKYQKGKNNLTPPQAPASEQLEYQCAICGQCSCSTEESPIGTIVLCQPAGALLHAAPPDTVSYPTKPNKLNPTNLTQQTMTGA